VLTALTADLAQDEAQLEVLQGLAERPATPAPKPEAEPEPEPESVADRMQRQTAERVITELESSEYLQKVASAVGIGTDDSERMSDGFEKMYVEFAALKGANPDLKFTVENFIKFVVEPRVQKIGGTVPEELKKPKPGREPASPGSAARGGPGVTGKSGPADLTGKTEYEIMRHFQDKYNIPRKDSDTWGLHPTSVTRARRAAGG
jgi:hypothetical protein